MSTRILIGDALARLRELPDESVHCCVTSPPYWGLRDYDVEGQVGLEDTPEAYVARLVEVFAEVRRVLRVDGTCWVNLGDSYAREPAKGGSGTPNGRNLAEMGFTGAKPVPSGLKPKDLVGIPWRVAFALQADGWWLRSDIIWHKPNPMPESVTDRPTKAHEYVFLLTKSERYAYDAGAIAEKTSHVGLTWDERKEIGEGGRRGFAQNGPSNIGGANGTRNARTVWPIATQPFPGSHFATMPPALAERCILAGCPKGGTVLDPFGGAGTTGLVADRLQRDAVLIELNAVYAEMARARITDAAPMLARVEVAA